MGDPADPATDYMGPVVNKASHEKHPGIHPERGQRRRTGRRRRNARGATRGISSGRRSSPTSQPTATIAQEEIFGPVLAVIKAKDFDDALQRRQQHGVRPDGRRVYDGTRKNLKKAEQEFFVGNLYLNRKCTGALVGVHPFGGFNMSGTDSKAGGRDYLLLFLQAKSIAEKVK